MPFYVFGEPPAAFDAVSKRGGPYFDALAELGVEVLRVPAGASVMAKPRGPWTFAYLPVPVVDVTGWVRDWQRGPCSIIMDVHFPIMRQESVIGDDETILTVLESREVMLANLAVACAVTVSQAPWAADLAEVNDRVWFLPDIEPDDEDSLIDFTVKFSEICGETGKVCAAQLRASKATVGG